MAFVPMHCFMRKRDAFSISRKQAKVGFELAYCSCPRSTLINLRRTSSSSIRPVKEPMQADRCDMSFSLRVSPITRAARQSGVLKRSRDSQATSEPPPQLIPLSWSASRLQALSVVCGV